MKHPELTDSQLMDTLKWVDAYLAFPGVCLELALIPLTFKSRGLNTVA
jgi:hypothetical protein